jgi:hypothetical protein
MPEARMTKDEGITKHECNVLALPRAHARNRMAEAKVIVVRLSQPVCGRRIRQWRGSAIIGANLVLQ